MIIAIDHLRHLVKENKTIDIDGHTYKLVNVHAPDNESKDRFIEAHDEDDFIQGELSVTGYEHEYTLTIKGIDSIKMALQANNMSSALNSFANYMRSMSKHDDSLNDSQYELLEKLRSQFYETLNDNNVEI